MVTYKEAGVNIDAGNKLVKIIKKIAPAVGGFSGLYPIKGTNYYLSASTDGVGTKLKLAFLLNKHDTVGIDLVAMNVDDVVCCGAKPLFFLDYYACSKLDLKVSEQIIKGIHKGCKLSGCILLGGETAEMPGFYSKGEYDLAGFAVGIVEKNRVIDGRKIKIGDVLIGLPSSGLHSNGYSLVHKIFSRQELITHSKILLEPTRIYTKQILKLLEPKNRIQSSIHGIAHITGGGFYDNIERLLPKNCNVVINKNSWEIMEIFKIIQKKGNIAEKEMYRVFNMGIGMVLIVDKIFCDRIMKLLGYGIIIGEVKKGEKKVEVI